jgi:hypothetical protein
MRAALAESPTLNLMPLDLKMPVLHGLGTLRELPTQARQVPDHRSALLRIDRRFRGAPWRIGFVSARRAGSW